MIASRIARLAQALLAGFLLVALGLGYWQVIRADELGKRSGNPRIADEAERIERGRILDRNGQVLAESRPGQNGRQRVYPQPGLGPVVGYYSVRLGSAGLEARYDDLLRGERTPDPITSLRRRLLDEPQRGADLVLTLDARLQRVAMDQLGGRPGAIVALDPRTGEVLALASSPSFDPNRIEQQIGRLQDDPNAPLVNRVTQGVYTPGSTFKLVTAAAAVDLGLPDLDRAYDCTRPVEIGALRPDCKNHAHLARITFRQAFAWSCNRSFALTGLQLGLPGPLQLADGFQPDERWLEQATRASAPRLEEYASRFGFGRAIPFDLEVTPSRLKDDQPWYPSLLAQTAFGQGQLAVTPLQMALVAAAVANGGVVPEPYLVTEARLPDGASWRLHEPGVRWSSAVRPETAARLNEMMQQSVEEAYARPARISGVKVGGKTGTAETGGGPPHSWFIGYAPADDPRVAVAAIYEHAGSGTDVATPAAQVVMAEALRLRSGP